LLGELLLAAERAEVPALVLDGRDIDLIPRTFMETLRNTLGLPLHLLLPIAAFIQREERQVLLIDSYDAQIPCKA
jgi:hypothetical protein